MSVLAVCLILAYAGSITYFNFSKEVTIRDLTQELAELEHGLSLYKGVIRPKVLFGMPDLGDREALCYLSNGAIENCDIHHSASEIYRSGTDDNVTDQVRLILTAEFQYNGH